MGLLLQHVLLKFIESKIHKGLAVLIAAAAAR